MKKTFTKQEIRDLFNKVIMDEVSFTRMVEIMNERVSERVNERVSERVSEAKKPNFKEGDFLHSDWDGENIIIIFKNQEDYKIHYHASRSSYFGVAVNDDRYWRNEGDFRPATEAEKQELLDALAKEGKRWNEEKLCVEDIHAELKDGDLAIFWDANKGTAIIGKYDYLIRNSPYPHKDKRGDVWRKAIKFESKEQYEKLLKWEI